MKRLLLPLCLTAVLTACQGDRGTAPKVVDISVPGGETPDEKPYTEPTQPLFPVGSEEVEGVAQPKGAVKQIVSVRYNHMQLDLPRTRSVKVYTYDALGRPASCKNTEYDYDDAGVQMSGQRTNAEWYFFLSDGKAEVRGTPDPQHAYCRYTLTADGLIGHTDIGYISYSKWTSTRSYDVSYKTIPGKEGRYVAAWTGCQGQIARFAIPWEYNWDSSGNLTSAVEQWPVGGMPEDPDEVSTAYYFYTDKPNPTLGQAFDVTGLLVAGHDGYPWSGRGIAFLPDYANSLFRNKAVQYTYTFSGAVLSRIEIRSWPFPNDSDYANICHRSVYEITYYQ